MLQTQILVFILHTRNSTGNHERGTALVATVVEGLTAADLPGLDHGIHLVRNPPDEVILVDLISS
jgi:hypothetical protein